MKNAIRKNGRSNKVFSDLLTCDENRNVNFNKLRNDLVVALYNGGNYMSASKTSILSAFLALADQCITLENLSKGGSAHYTMEMELSIYRKTEHDKEKCSSVNRVILY